MKKGLFVILVVLMLLPNASATHLKGDISVNEFSKHIYNLGDTLAVSYTVSQPSDASVIFKLILECSNFSLEYFTQPIELAAHEGKEVAASSLTLQKSMAGSCAVNSSLFSTSTGEILATMDSDSFIVTPELQFEAATDKQEYLPGDEIAVSLNVSPTYEGFSGNAIIGLDGRQGKINVTGNDAAYAVETENNTKSGNHELIIEVEDSYGNRGERIVSVTVSAVPTKLEIKLNDNQLKPEETVRGYVDLYDQAGDEIDGPEADVRVINPKSQETANLTIEVGNVFSYRLEQDAVPGNYTVKASASGLDAEAAFSVEEVEQIESTFDNRILKIKNIGNVKYGKPINISLIKEGKAYSIVKNLDLKPSEGYEVDLYKELPEGSYNITIPNKGGMAVYSDVSIKDERPFGKKIGDALSPLTGSAVKGGIGGLAKKTLFLLLAFALFAFITITAVKWYRNRRTHGEKREIQMQKEIRNAAEVSEKIMQDKKQQAPQQMQKPAQKQMPEKKPLLRDDPEIKKFVDRVLREK